MKTHITTKENPIFKEGIEFEFSPAGPESYHKNKNEMLLINADKKPSWHKNRYFIEVEKPEFTKSDVLEIVGDWLKTERNIPFDQYFDNRIENRGK